MSSTSRAVAEAPGAGSFRHRSARDGHISMVGVLGLVVASFVAFAPHATGSVSDPVIAVSSDVQVESGLNITKPVATSNLALSMNPDVAWLAGDEAQDGTMAEYNTYSQHWGRLKLDIVSGSYDHDNATNYAAYFGPQGTPLPRAVDYGAWRVYFFDSEGYYTTLGVGSPTYNFIRDDLAAHPGRPIAAVWHSPRWSTDAVHGSTDNSHYIWQLLYNAHADLVVNGHVHSYQRWKNLNPGGQVDSNGIREFVVSTANYVGYNLRSDSRVDYQQNSQNGVMKLVLHPTSYEWQFVSTTGQVLDQGSQAVHNTPAQDVSAPSVPADVSVAAVSATQARVTWAASTDNVGVTGYRVRRDGSAIGTTAATAYDDEGLSPETSYGYSVTAFDAMGNESAPSTAVTVTTPAAAHDSSPPTVPSDVSATVVSPSRVDLSWTASSDDVAVAGYRVYRNGTLVNPTPTAGTAYSDTGLPSVSGLTYEVAAVDTSGLESARSSPVSAKDVSAPTRPTGVTATIVSGTRVDLSWTASTDNVAVTGYEVFRDGVLAGVSAATAYSDTGLQSTSVSYRVTAVDAAGNRSEPSGSVAASDRIAPTVPTGLNVAALRPTSLTLSWTGSSDNVAVAGYRVYRNGVLVTATPVPTASFSDSGLRPNTRYTYKVAAVDTSGNVSAQSAALAVRTPKR